MVFAATTGSSDDLKAIISAVSTLVEEATFVATSEGITFRGMDPSHVALVDISWPNSAFERYECDAEIKFGVRIEEFDKIIKRAEKKNAIELSVGDDNMLHISLGRNKSYKMRLVESSANETPLPKIPYDATVVLPISTFSRTLDDVVVVSEYMTIECEGNKATFSGKGDSGEVAIEMDTSMEELEELESPSKNVGTYSMEYLKPIVKAVGSAVDSVKCEYSDNKPLRVEFKISAVGVIHFYLAPRVES